MPYFTREFFDFRYAIHLPKYGILGMMTPSHSVYNHLSRCPFTLSQFRDIFHQSKKRAHRHFSDEPQLHSDYSEHSPAQLLHILSSTGNLVLLSPRRFYLLHPGHLRSHILQPQISVHVHRNPDIAVPHQVLERLGIHIF